MSADWMKQNKSILGARGTKLRALRHEQPIRNRYDRIFGLDRIWTGIVARAICGCGPANGIQGTHEGQYSHNSHRDHHEQTMMIPQAGPEAASRLINFVNASPTPFHAVRSAATKLEQAGFRKARTMLSYTLSHAHTARVDSGSG